MIRIRFAAGSEEHVAIGFSSLLECALSLHVLVAPSRHALLHPWVRRMRRLPPDLKRRVHAFAFLFRWHVPDLLLPTMPTGFATAGFESELGRLSAYPPELLLEEFARPLYDHEGRHGEGIYNDPTVRATLLQRAAAYGRPSRRLAELLLDDPAEFTAQFVCLLEDFWQSAFGREWHWLEPQLRASVTESERLLATSGIWSVLGRLPSHCRAHPSRRELEIDLPHEHTVDVSASRPLVLSPSFFVWPQLRVSCDPPWPTTLIYAAPQQFREAQPRIPPGELVGALRALADDTRLRVLNLIAERPRSTQELAPLVGLSPAGLSKTLTRLTEAGFVTSRREGYYVGYSLAPDGGQRFQRRFTTSSTSASRRAVERRDPRPRWSTLGDVAH
jgi:DNA-binding transcriptional ArsR family regulator